MKEIKNVEIYYADGSMERVSNEETTEKKLTQEQVEFIVDTAMNDLNNFKCGNAKYDKVTIDNYEDFNIDDFPDMSFSYYRTCISLLDALL